MSKNVKVAKKLADAIMKLGYTNVDGKAVSRGHALEIVAHVADMPNWDTLSGILKASGRNHQSTQVIEPVKAFSEAGIIAEVHSDDLVFEVNFDATLWFRQASDAEIIALAAIGWGGDSEADDVAEFCEPGDSAISEMFGYIQRMKGLRNAPGFECHVNEGSAMNWLEKNRPALAAKLSSEQWGSQDKNVGLLDIHLIHVASPWVAFADSLLAIAGVSVIEDPEQPGMNYGYPESGLSFGTHLEAQTALVTEIQSWIMGEADLSLGFWDSLSCSQKLDVARDVYKKQPSENNITEILQHKISWFLRGEGSPTEMDECSVEHIETLIREGCNQGELCVLGEDGNTEYRGWWSIKKD